MFLYTFLIILHIDQQSIRINIIVLIMSKTALCLKFLLELDNQAIFVMLN